MFFEYKLSDEDIQTEDGLVGGQAFVSALHQEFGTSEEYFVNLNDQYLETLR